MKYLWEIISVVLLKRQNKMAKIICFLLSIATATFAQAASIVSTMPSQNDLNVSGAANISVTFDTEMDESTITSSSFVVNARSTGLHGGAISYDNPTRTVTIDPTDDFAVGEIVTVVLTTGVESSVSLPLENSYSWSFTVEAPDGTGEFVLHADLDVLGTCQSVFAADLDNDGDQDVIAGHNFAENQISVWLNHGDATFESRVDYEVAYAPQAVIAADMNKDGILDLAVGNWSDWVSILIGNGDGTFAPYVSYPAGDGPRSIVSADFDTDGDLDLATANRISDDVSVFLNNGDGSLQPFASYSSDDGPSDLYAADLDNDGDVDLAVANGDGFSKAISILKNNGDGTFAPRVDIAPDPNAGPKSVYGADVNDNGNIDLVAVFGDLLYVLLNNGSGNFGVDDYYGATGVPWKVIAADIDSDDDLDLLTANSYSSVVRTYFNDDTGNLSYGPNLSAGDGPISVFAADFDGDGSLDIVSGNGAYYQGTSSVSILLNAGEVCPDLVVKDFELTGDDSAARGEDISDRLQLEVANIGNAPSVETTVGVYLSEVDFTLSDPDTIPWDSLLIIGSALIPVLEENDTVPIVFTGELIIPQDWSSDSARMYLILDPDDICLECNESNNLLTSPAVLSLFDCPTLTELSHPLPYCDQYGVDRTTDLVWNSAAHVLLSSDFEGKQLGEEIDTRGADYGEPIEVNDPASARVFPVWQFRRDCTAWSRGLKMDATVTGVTASVSFEFPNSDTYGSGTIYVQADILLGSGIWSMVVGGGRESADIAAKVGVNDDGDITVLDGTGLIWAGRWGEKIHVLLVFHMDMEPATYDLYVNGEFVIGDRLLHNTTKIGDIMFSARGPAHIYVDNLLVTRDSPWCQTTYDVYHGIVGTGAEELVCDDVSVPACELDLLFHNLKYFWRVVAHNDDFIENGPVWEFTTRGGDDDPSRLEVADEWVQYYEDKPCDYSDDIKDVKACKDDAQKFSQVISEQLTDWNLEFSRGNANAAARDFGTANEGTYGIDNVDFAYFCGHGGNAFSHENDDCTFWSFDCTNEWGNKDLEWLATPGCQFLSPPNPVQSWTKCFAGLHMICGFSSDAKATNYGEHFAKRLVGDYGNGPYKITGAWFWEAKRSLGGGFPWTIAFLTAHPKYLKEYIWGLEEWEEKRGRNYPVFQDPEVGQSAFWYSFDNDRGPGLARSRPGKLESDLVETVTLPNRHGPVVLIPSTTLMRSQAESDSMPVLSVTPRLVDEFYVRSIAEALCEEYWLFCAGDVFWDDDIQAYYMSDASHSLLVYEATGGWEYMNEELFLSSPESPPTLMTDEEAVSKVRDFLLNAAWLPTDAVEEPPTRFIQVTLDRSTGSPVADSAWDLSVFPFFSRLHNGSRIVGPGAEFTCSYGEGDFLHHMSHGGWRDVSTGDNVGVISLEQALGRVAAFGGDLPFGGWAPSSDTFIVTIADLGYYEPYADSSIDELDIVWILEGWSVFDGDSSFYQVLVPAKITESINGFPAFVLGGAALSTYGREGIAVTGIDSTGECGVAIDLSPQISSYANILFDDVELHNDGQSLGMTVEGEFNGSDSVAANSKSSSSGEAGYILLSSQEGSVAVTADFTPLGASDVSVEVVLNGAVVGVTSVVAGEQATSVTYADPSGVSIESIQVDAEESLELSIQFVEQHEITLGGGSMVIGDQIKLSAANASQSISHLTSVAFVGNSLGYIILLDLSFEPPACCVGSTGNIDNDPAGLVDLGDLTALIDYLFISFALPVCLEEANVDGSVDGIVDLGDLTTLIDFLFISFTPPAPCQ